MTGVEAALRGCGKSRHVVQKAAYGADMIVLMEMRQMRRTQGSGWSTGGVEIDAPMLCDYTSMGTSTAAVDNLMFMSCQADQVAENLKQAENYAQCIV